MLSPTLVAIGMPVFNGERHLARALDSLLLQSHNEIEIYISDNASTDGTGEICRAYQAGDPRVRFSTNLHNEGAIANFRKVLAQTSAPYFMWASHDDWWEPDFLSHIMAIHQGTPGLSLVACEAQYALGDGTPLPFFPEGEYWRLHEPRLESVFVRMRAVLDHGYGNMIYGVFQRAALTHGDGTTVLDPILHSGIFNEIPVLLQVARKGGIRVSDRIMFHKRTNVTTYRQVAAEYDLILPKDPPAELPFLTWSLAAREALKLAVAIMREVDYHWRAYWGILAAIPFLDLALPASLALGFQAAVRIIVHLAHLQVYRVKRLRWRSEGIK